MPSAPIPGVPRKTGPTCRFDGFLWYNKNIFKDAGRKTPDDLLNEGNRNRGPYRESAIALTIAGTDGNITQWGTAIDILDAYIVTTGMDVVNYNNGQPVNNIKSGQVSRAMNFFINLVPQDNCVYRGGNSRDQFARGKIAMIESHLWYRDPLREMLKNDEISFVPTPKDPQADKYYIMESLSSAGFFPKKGAKNVSGAAAYICSVRYSQIDTDAQKKNFALLQKEVGWFQALIVSRRGGLTNILLLLPVQPSACRNSPAKCMHVRWAASHGQPLPRSRLQRLMQAMQE